MAAKAVARNRARRKTASSKTETISATIGVAVQYVVAGMQDLKTAKQRRVFLRGIGAAYRQAKGWAE